MIDLTKEFEQTPISLSLHGKHNYLHQLLRCS